MDSDSQTRTYDSKGRFARLVRGVGGNEKASGRMSTTENIRPTYCSQDSGAGGGAKRKEGVVGISGKMDIGALRANGRSIR